MDLRKKQRVVLEALEDIKGRDIVVFNTARMPSMFERVVIASGDSTRQVKALADWARPAPRGQGGGRMAARTDRRRRGALPKAARLVALDERGKDFTTAQFSTLLSIETAFVIGGPDGLDEGIKKQSALVLRVSSLTPPPAPAPVVLLEQPYWAATPLTRHPVHTS